METNPTLVAPALLRACLASLMLVATSVPAQTIYKQVDENGRVMFTDQPNAGARVITTYESGRSRGADSEAMPETPRRAPEADSSQRAAENPYANWRRVTPSSPELTARRVDPVNAPSEPQRAEPMQKTTTTIVQSGSPSPQAQTNAPTQTAALQPMQAQSPATTYNDVTRAVNTYTALNTPLAVQVDATEAARRARQEMSKGSQGSPVLVVQAPAKDHEAVHQKSGMDAFYVLWVATFLVMAAGLLYVGWQVIRLIMGNAFPRWQIGVG